MMFSKKQRIRPVPEPAVSFRKILENVTQLPDEVWWQYAFASSPMNQVLPYQKKMLLARKAARCGDGYAMQYKENDKNLVPEKIAKSLGLSVTVRQCASACGQVFFAQFTEPDKIVIYEDSIHRFQAFIQEETEEGDWWRTADIRQVILAHELFHWVEMKEQKTIYTRTERIQLWKIGPLTNHSRISCLSEIAAMHFAKTLTNFPFSPYVLDVLLIYPYNKEAASASFRSLIRATEPERTAGVGSKDTERV